MNLLEVMIVVVIMATMAAAIGMGVMSAKADSDRNLAKTDVHNLAQVAEAYALSRGVPCPSIAELRESSFMRRGSKTEDPWGHSYEILCGEGELDVRSAGPDEEVGTEDDISLD